MKDFIKSVLGSFMDFFYPPLCLICKQDTSEDKNKFVCESCMKNIRTINSPYCMKCGREFVSEDAFKNIENPVCGKCQSEKNKVYYDRVFGVGEYDGVLKEMIHLLKYNKKEQIGKDLGDILLSRISSDSDISKADFLIPVPLYWLRKRVRGFNQSEEIGRYVSACIKIPMVNLLKRKKNTKPQVGLTGQERIKNVSGAFKINSLAQKTADFIHRKNFSLKGKTVILLDDVVTTGATVNECAKILKKEGASGVKVICLAMVK